MVTLKVSLLKRKVRTPLMKIRMWRVANGDQEELEAIRAKPRESATENKPPMDSQGSQARLKSCGKSTRELTAM